MNSPLGDTSLRLSLKTAQAMVYCCGHPRGGCPNHCDLLVKVIDSCRTALAASSGASSECQCPYPPEPHPTSVHLVGTPTEAEKAYGLTLEPLAKEALSRDESDKQFYSSSGDARLAMIWEKLKGVESQGK